MDLQFQEISINSKKHRCGCYVSDPTFAKDYPNKFIMVPLKTSEYTLQIANSIANVSLLQTYQNPTDKYLELEYSFPINPNACVYRFVATFGNKRMEGIVKEKEQAKIEYNQAIKQGKKAAYGEINAESKDILTLKVGNVAPKQNVKIEIVYLQELTLSCNTFYQLHMMGTISPRYMNYIPPQAIKAGLRNDAAKTQGNFYWNFKIQLKTTHKVLFFDSNLHDIELLSQNDARTQSAFAMSKSSIPNKDFIFSYTTEDYQLPSYVFGRTDAGSTAMLSFIPKFCTLNIDDAYKASVLGKGYQTDIQNAKGEYIFLLDRSGSMGGSRIQKAKQALILFIKSLPQDTYFNVISFGSDSQNLFAKSTKYSDNEVKQAVDKIKKMSADMGGTEIYEPLSNLLQGKPVDGYPKQIFLLTDGGVSNTEGVIRMVGLNNKYSRVHTIGIGNGCSQQLILGCAKKGKGYHVLITDQQDPSQKIIQLLTDSLSPVISKIKLAFDKSIVDTIIPNPQNMPYILKNQLVNFYITFKGQLSQPTKFHFSYQDTLNKKPYATEIAVDPTAQNESFIDRMAHFKKIRLLQQSHSNNSNIEQNMFYVKVVDKKAEIIKQSVKHQILSEFTAFVCTEKELVDGKYQQIQDTGKVKVQIVNPLPVEYEQQGYLNECSFDRSISAARMKKSAPSPPPSAKYRKGLSENRAMMAPKMARSMKVEQQKSMKVEQQKKSGGFFDSIKSFFGSGPKKQAIAPSPLKPAAIRQSQMLAPIGASLQSMSYGAKIKNQEAQSAKLQLFADECEMESAMQQNMVIQNLPASLSYQGKKKKKEAQKQTAKKDQKRRNIQIKSQPSLNISQIISYQTIEGSWKVLDLIAKLFTLEIQKLIESEPDLIAVITYLISKWIEKNHPEKQYSLVVKKGLNFAKKNAANYQKFSELYDQYLQ